MASQNRTLVVLALVIVLIVGTIPLPIAAQGGSYSVMLDTEQQQVETVELDGATYTVYEYSNMLPYASGIEVTRNGERVTDETTAHRVLRTVAWQRAVDDLDSSDIESLREIDRDVQDINQVVTPTLRVVEAVIDRIDWLQQNGLAGRSYWDMVTVASPSMERLEHAVRELRNDLREWKTAADQVNNNVPQLVDDLESVRNGDDVNHAQMAQRFREVVRGLETLEEKSNAVSSSMDDAARASESAASEVRGVPGIGGDLSNFLGGVGDRFDSASNDVSGFSSSLGQQQSQLADVQSSAVSERNEMMSSWKARQSAEMKVQGTLGGAGLVLAGALLVIGRRRRSQSSLEELGTPTEDTEPSSSDSPEVDSIVASKTYEPRRTKRYDGETVYVCGGCGALVEDGDERCRSCKGQLDWVSV